jgi:hypothetical protein
MASFQLKYFRQDRKLPDVAQIAPDAVPHRLGNFAIFALLHP